MNDFWAIVCGAGLRDGLNPCVFMACAVLIALRVRLVRQRVIFIMAYALGFSEFTFGAAQVLTFRKEFFVAAKILYLILGVWAFISGVIFFKDWFLLRTSAGAGQEDVRGLPQKNFLTAYLITVVPAVILSALATLIPVNNYVLLLGNEVLLKGQWQEIVPLLAGYVFCSIWPLWLTGIFLSIKNLPVSLVKIIYASVFFTASSCVILMFK